MTTAKLFNGICTRTIVAMFLLLNIAFTFSFQISSAPYRTKGMNRLSMSLPIDMTGKIVFVGGVADSSGYGWAIAKACAEAGAKVRPLRDLAGSKVTDSNDKQEKEIEEDGECRRERCGG